MQAVGLGHVLVAPGGAKIFFHECILTKLKIFPINHTFPTILEKIFCLSHALGVV